MGRRVGAVETFLRLVASDGQLSGSDDLTIIVLPPVNQPPVVDAGASQTVVLPSSATLTGKVTDDGLPVGSTVTVTWSYPSGFVK